MSLITRCTMCETLFKVVPDQLRISDGWVRCGQCGEIFDASQNLLVAQADEPIPRARVDTGPDLELAESQPADTLPVDQAAAPTELPLEPSTSASGIGPGLSAVPVADAVKEELVAPEASTIPSVDGQHVSSNSIEDPLAVSFMRDTAEQSRWRRPVVRGLLVLLALGLLAALAMQALHQERDRIAAVEPAVRPWLVAMCALTGCRLAPLRQIDSIVIDGSSFERVRGDAYRFGFSLRNTAPIEVAMPAIELSLTDAQDQTLMRRVFMPSEFAALTQGLAGGADWSSNLNLQVKVGPQNERITGYRVLTFYP